MPHPDTPTRAAAAAQAAGRPQTRLWAKRLAAAQTDALARDRLRAEADRYLAAADEAAQKKTALAGGACAAAQSHAKAVAAADAGSDADTAAAWQNGAPEVVEAAAGEVVVEAEAGKLREALQAGTDWEVRAAALKAFVRAVNPELTAALAALVAAQLADLRSALVAVAADAAVAAAPFADDEAALVLVEAALATATKTKAVMAEAGRRAALAVLAEAEGGGRAWEAAGKVVCGSANTRAREAAVACFADERAGKVVCGDIGAEVFRTVLEKAAVDKAAGVRAGAKAMLERYEVVRGKAEAEKLVGGLSRDATARLGGNSANAKPAAAASTAGKHGAAPRGRKPAGGGKMSIKDMIKQKRLEAAKATKAAAAEGGGEGGGAPPDVADEDVAKRRSAEALQEKENHPVCPAHPAR